VPVTQSTLVARVLPRFPANVVGVNPVTVTQFGLNYNIGLNVNALAGMLPSTALTSLTFDTNILAAAMAIPISASSIQTRGYRSIGDGGGAMFTRGSGRTSFADFQSADGAWWNLAMRGQVLNVKMFGAYGDAVHDDTAAINGAIAYLGADGLAGSGIVFIPGGLYKISNTISTVPAPNMTLLGAGRTATYLDCSQTDVVALNIGGGGQQNVKGLTVFAKGSSRDQTGVFGASNPCCQMASSGAILSECQFFGGTYVLYVTAVDALIMDCIADQPYGRSTVYGFTGCGCWWIRNKFDHDWPGNIAATGTLPPVAWVATHAYTAGNIVIVGAFWIQCTVGGTSDGSPPALKNYGTNITDGGVTWVLVGPTGLTGYLLEGAFSENHLTQCDFTATNLWGGSYAYSIFVNAASFGNSPTCYVDSSVIAQAVGMAAADTVSIQNCEMGGPIQVNTSYTGQFTINGNWWVAGLVPVPTHTVGANVSKWTVQGNIFGDSTTLTISAGTSDHYIVTSNTGLTVSDGGSGTHKIVTGNVI
jgi:hypothetical protein